ncbi:MlaE family lipid ABC transporter permease subunit [Leptolyngbya sp. PCC 6406]|uniref:MlaE family lipid ABC transporter permease subunit n=1 Tax=Leptolyngbya sp. PCC 6406 TaxID=1173264 RepID=UPI0002ACA8C7|nr:MlaE family lipid ABC transporter permease subunit [Leptolyngbya sp. PCC 6406]
MIYPFRETSPDPHREEKATLWANRDRGLARVPFLSVRSCSYHILMALVLGGQVLVRVLRGRVQRHRVMEHMVAAGPGALVPVLLTNLFAGMIFAIQTAREMERFGVLQGLGGAFALGFCRELAPILSAAILAGQVGSAFAAEIGSMKITEQIDALKVLRTDPIDYLVVPRVLACCIMLPILTMMGLVLAVGGGAFIAHQLYHLEPSVFMESVQTLLEPADLLAVLMKSVIFGAMTALSGCCWGLTTTCSKTLGRAATSAVVTTWVSLFVVDFCITLMLFQGIKLNY